jgi:hypothetical protein
MKIRNLTSFKVSVTAAEQAHNGFTLWPEWPVVIKPKTNGDERPQNIQLKGVGIHVYERPTEYEVLGLPEPVEGVYFLVEEAVGAFLKGTRSDVLMPIIGPETEVHCDDEGLKTFYVNAFRQA